MPCAPLFLTPAPCRLRPRHMAQVRSGSRLRSAAARRDARPLVQARRRGIESCGGIAAMTLKALRRWGVGHRVRVAGKRADHYAAETDFWKMISRVLDERERQEIAAAVSTVELAKRDVAAAGVDSTVCVC